jgi:hypothetical protein
MLDHLEQDARRALGVAGLLPALYCGEAEAEAFGDRDCDMPSLRRSALTSNSGGT